MLSGAQLKKLVLVQLSTSCNFSIILKAVTVRVHCSNLNRNVATSLKKPCCWQPLKLPTSIPGCTNYCNIKNNVVCFVITVQIIGIMFLSHFVF